MPLKGPTHNLLRLTPSELQHWGSNLMNTRDIWEELNCLASGKSWRGSFLPDRSAGKGHLCFDEPSPHRASRLVPYLRLPQPDSQGLPHPSDSLRPGLTQLSGPPKLFPGAFPYKWPVLAHVSDFPKISQTSSIWPQQALYFSLSGPRPNTSGSQPWFKAWPHMSTSKPSTSSSHLHIAL